MFKFTHNSINVIDLEKSLAFYKQALGLVEMRRKDAADGSYTLIFLGDGQSGQQLELTWLRDWDKDAYDLGDNEIHIGMVTDDIDAAHALHAEMGCICHENPAMGLYFINDPDGYWIEIVPQRK